MRPRSGFSLLELIIVLTLLATLTMIAAPRISVARERGSMSSARQQLSATLTSARAAAIQKGRPARLRVKDGVVSVWVLNMEDSVQVVAPTNYSDEYGVSLSPSRASDTLITFDPRGFARLADDAAFRFARGGLRDSVCLTRLGQLLPTGCVR
ncbi:MAG TPA: GspH/FimT family pseudopilin [Gemmatimonadales bacterium]